MLIPSDDAATGIITTKLGTRLPLTVKRRLLIAAIFLLAGAVVNAWGVILLLDRRDWTYENINYTRVEWPHDVPDHWPQVDTIYGWKAFGFLRRFYVARDGEGRWYSINTTGAGWPCLSLQWEIVFNVPVSWGVIWDTSATTVPPDDWKGELSTQTHWRGGLPVPSKRILEDWERLPLRPLWPGFAVNTLFDSSL